MRADVSLLHGSSSNFHFTQPSDMSMLLCAEVVEYACNIAPDLMGEYVEGVSTGMDTYSIKQPLGVDLTYVLAFWNDFAVLVGLPIFICTYLCLKEQQSCLVLLACTIHQSDNFMSAHNAELLVIVRINCCCCHSHTHQLGHMLL